MPTESSIQITPSELVQIVQSVFEAMLGLVVGESETPWYPGGERLTAVVHLSGEWNGAVLLECDRSQACHFAGRYLSMESPEAMDDVVRDVLGELANMIGGNLKSVLAQGIRLSMPSIVNGSDYNLRVCGSEVTERLAFNSTEGPFWITVLTSPCEGQARVQRSVPLSLQL